MTGVICFLVFIICEKTQHSLLDGSHAVFWCCLYVFLLGNHSQHFPDSEWCLERNIGKTEQKKRLIVFFFITRSKWRRGEYFWTSYWLYMLPIFFNNYSCSCHNSYYLFQYYGHINHSEYFVNDPSTPDLFDYEVPIHLLLPAIPVLIFHMVSSRGIPYWVLRQLCCGKFVLWRVEDGT